MPAGFRGGGPWQQPGRCRGDYVVEMAHSCRAAAAPGSWLTTARCAASGEHRAKRITERQVRGRLGRVTSRKPVRLVACTRALHGGGGWARRLLHMERVPGTCRSRLYVQSGSAAGCWDGEEMRRSRQSRPAPAVKRAGGVRGARQRAALAGVQGLRKGPFGRAGRARVRAWRHEGVRTGWLAWHSEQGREGCSVAGSPHTHCCGWACD
jgi:hypothetical protein